MKILIIGQGGREHALAWQIKKSPLVSSLYIAPGNAGTAEVGINVPLEQNDYEGLLAWAKEKQIDLTIVGPEQPLVDGLVDMFNQEKLLIFGPGKMGARLEGSKAFAKELLLENNVPTASFITTDNLTDVKDYLANHQGPYVLKVDGLAAGKGVLILKEASEAYQEASRILKDKVFGEAGQKIILEEYLEGPEASILTLVNGLEYMLLEPSRDYQKIGEGDTGLNTGGMGALSPVLDITEEVKEGITKTIIEPVLRGLDKKGISFRGVLYAGLIFTSAGPKVLEFNVRFGDPETQVLLPRLESDLLPYLLGLAKGELIKEPLRWSKETCLGVVLASQGYPKEYKKGYPITGLADLDPQVLAFHSGSKLVGDEVLTNGGRVLCLVGKGEDLAQTRALVYKEIKKIKFKDMYYRRDLGGEKK